MYVRRVFKFRMKLMRFTVLFSVQSYNKTSVFFLESVVDTVKIDLDC